MGTDARALEFVKQLKASVDIVTVIGEYVPVRKAGPNRYAGRCPFHTGKTPSFSESSQHQYYKCSGCDAKGDVIKFVMERVSPRSRFPTVSTAAFM